MSWKEPYNEIANILEEVMRMLLLTVFLPVSLFALERVNLIKDHSFELNNGVWNSYTSHDSAIVNTYDFNKALSGFYSGSLDTRKASTGDFADSAVIIQGFLNKHLADIESLFVNFAVVPLGEDFSDSLSSASFVGFHVSYGTPYFREVGYLLRAPDIKVSTPYSPMNYIENRSFSPDTNWHDLSYPTQKQFLDIGLVMESEIDSFVLIGYGGGLMTPWRGQKIYWDDIRLTGYADYDVGIKGILSRDSIGNAYIPTARIKNFGRKPADSFLVIATIEGGSGIVYADTLSWSLTADTEDTVSFKEFKPSDAANYTLTVSSVMTPDESDEDDAVFKTLYGTGVEEQPIPAGLVFNVSSFSSCPQVSYTLPLGEQGTISLYDPSGRRIESLTVTGSGSINLRSNLSSGVYFVKLESGKKAITKKAVILR